MKTMSKVIMLIAVLISFSAVSFAQDSDQTRGPMMGGDMMMGAGSGPGGGMGSMGTMMGMMNRLVATSDGGVVVMIGNKLYKYDKDLNLKKEAEIKVDVKGMQRMMDLLGTPGEIKAKAKKPAASGGTPGHEVHHPQ